MSRSTPTQMRHPHAHHQLDRELKKNREQFECRGSGNGMERRSRVSEKCLLLPPEVGQVTSTPVGRSRKLASLFCQQAAWTPDEPRRGETRHPRGRMRVHELAGVQRTSMHRRHGRLRRRQEGLWAKEDGMRHRPVCQRQTGIGAAVAAEEATRPSSRESPRISVAKVNLDLEDESSSEGQEVESVQGTPTRVLCEQVVPLLGDLDRKAAKYADRRHRGSYVKLVRNRTRIKVATNPQLISLDRKYRELEEKNDALQGHLTLSRKLHKAPQLRDDAAAEALREFVK
ncbi:hypothetical protein AXG93_4084s1000 [Marchantia polymorpha subsp. ruderalis]|uniref:Uncharacterized protein n=1 Tax=Marchantia polymorpha subsp. ruderalis TaxID=1480154 RepID=A0A176VTA7_MARPO|nr:hypothetical protein AXG93_4084s1000 [Marchantia polymorpha subsp. ruderalis]